MNKGSVLVSGASFAGLAAAFWMARAGYAVTVVEIAPELRKGGTPVNVKGDIIGIVDRMGLLEAISANRIETHTVELWSRSGPIAADTWRLQPDAGHSSNEGIEYEIERDALTGLLFNLVTDHVEIIFDESIVRLEELPDGVGVEFRRSDRRTFDLVLGCDGIHSNVRRLWFGEEAAYAHFLNTYGSVTIVPRSLVGEGTMAIYQTPGKMVVLTAYHGKTDIVALFTSNDRIKYDRQNRAQQTALVADHLEGEGWRVPELIEEIEQAEYFYFSELSQIHMPEWTKGRVGLVGDAAFCASAAAGMGGSLAINGAAALGNAFASCDGDYVTAFATYNETFRSSVEAVQDDAASFCKGIEVGKIV